VANFSSASKEGVASSQYLGCIRFLVLVDGVCMDFNENVFGEWKVKGK
jgi:hypothetical protein